MVELPISPLSENRANEIHVNKRTGKRWIGKTNEFETYKGMVRTHLQNEIDGGLTPTNQPLELTVIFYYKRSHRKKEELEGLPTKDVDNGLKPLLDALEGFLYEDDTQIVSLNVEKRPADDERLILKWNETDRETLLSGE